MDDPETYVSARLMPPDIILKDPSKLVKAEAQSLLDFWLDRQTNPKVRVAFDFKAYRDVNCEIVQVQPTGKAQARRKGKPMEPRRGKAKQTPHDADSSSAEDNTDLGTHVSVDEAELSTTRHPMQSGSHNPVHVATKSIAKHHHPRYITPNSESDSGDILTNVLPIKEGHPTPRKQLKESTGVHKSSRMPLPGGDNEMLHSASQSHPRPKPRLVRAKDMDRTTETRPPEPVSEEETSPPVQLGKRGRYQPTLPKTPMVTRAGKRQAAEQPGEDEGSPRRMQRAK